MFVTIILRVICGQFSRALGEGESQTESLLLLCQRASCATTKKDLQDLPSLSLCNRNPPSFPPNSAFSKKGPKFALCATCGCSVASRRQQFTNSFPKCDILAISFCSQCIFKARWVMSLRSCQRWSRFLPAAEMLPTCFQHIP